MDNARPKAIVAAVAFVIALVVSLWAIPRGSATATTAATSSAQSQGSGSSTTGDSGSSSSSGMSTGSSNGSSTNWRTAMNQMKAWDDSFPAKTQGLGGQPLTPQILPDGTKVFHLTTQVVKWEIYPGHFTQAWTYNGAVPGPLIQLNVGDKVRIVVKNELPEPTVIHWHGIPGIPNAMDGVPDITQAPIIPGATYTYAFTANAPAVSWYHSHYDGTMQVTNGLYGTILIGHPKVPAGVHVDQYYNMMLQDSGNIGLTINGKSFPATQEIKEPLGGWLEVNYIDAGTMAHPMHLHGVTQLVIAQDGNPVPQPYLVNTLNVSPGQTFTVLVHATNPGIWAWHCHIFPHSETAQGMFGLFTELDIYKPKA